MIKQEIKRVILSILLLMAVCPFSSGQEIIEDIGHYTQIGLPLSALGVSIIKGDTKGMIQLTKSFVVESVIVIGLKRSINRKRPSGGKYSFPSGHTALSFMSSTYLWKRYGWEYGIPATALAAFVGYSRFGTDEPVHFFSDVVVGAVIGIGSSWIFTKKQESNMEVDIIGDMSYIGLKLRLNLN